MVAAILSEQVLLDSAKVRREILRLYDKDPQDWKVLVGRDSKGFYDLLFTHRSDAWQVKEYQVNPYKFVGLGARLRNISADRLAVGEYAFGLRPIDIDLMKELANVMDDPHQMSDVASRLLREKPITTQEAVQNPAILHGPIFESNNPLETLSAAHTKLDEKLRKQLQQIVRRDYRHTITPYL